MEGAVDDRVTHGCLPSLKRVLQAGRQPEPCCCGQWGDLGNMGGNCTGPLPAYGQLAACGSKIGQVAGNPLQGGPAVLHRGWELVLWGLPACMLVNDA